MSKEPQLYSQIDSDFKTRYAQEYQQTNQRLSNLERGASQIVARMDSDKTQGMGLSFFEGI